MKHTIQSFEPRYNRSFKAIVLSRPNWFERIFLKKKSGQHEIIVPGKVAADKVQTARVINSILKMKK